jgi:hypothetical protein
LPPNVQRRNEDSNRNWRKEIIVGVLVAMFLAALDHHRSACATNYCSFLRNAEYLSWIVTAYLLTEKDATKNHGEQKYPSPTTSANVFQS